ncbi:MAG TPA: hypothetical protein ENN39_08335 [Desulfonatronum sp.]|nr:hypothetical protein [Desulfonatronum sp.]
MPYWLFKEGLFAAQMPSEWSHWPFGPSILGGWLNMLTKFIFIGLVLVLIMYLLRYLFGPGGPMREETQAGEASDQALEILRRRLASGEITLEEYEKLQKALEK